MTAKRLREEAADLVADDVADGAARQATAEQRLSELAAEQGWEPRLLAGGGGYPPRLVLRRTTGAHWDHQGMGTRRYDYRRFDERTVTECYEAAIKALTE